MIRGLTRHDTADRDFVERIQRAFETAEQDEQHLTYAEAARLEMLRRHGIITDTGSAAEARERMLRRHGIITDTDSGAEEARRRMIRRREKHDK